MTSLPSAELLLDSLLEIAAEAAQVVLEVYDTPFRVDYKGPKDPVTLADRKANALICKRLRERYPGVPIVAEESDPESFSGFRKAENVFFVDPVDGPREFVDRNDQFVVMIGVLQGDAATVGVIDAPALHVAWGGAVGLGAWRFQGGQRTPIHVSQTSDLSQARVVASRSHRSDQLERALELIGAREAIAIGSAGLKGAEIARGGAEAYVAPGRAGKRWDACASDALVTAAGGLYTDASGTPIDYRSESLANTEGVLASNRLLHEALLERVRKARQDRGAG